MSIPEHFTVLQRLKEEVQSLDEMHRLFALLKELYDMTDENKKIFDKYGVEYVPEGDKNEQRDL